MELSQSFQQAFSWIKQQNGKTMLVWLGGALIILSVCVFLLWHAVSSKTVMLVIDGEPHEVETRTNELSELLEERSISIDEHDYISKPVNSEIENGERIVIDHAHPVQVIDGGELTVRYTTASTVGQALRELGIKVDADDEVRPGVGAELSAQDTIRIVRVERRMETEQEPIAFKTIEVKDEQLQEGKKEVRQEGREGTLTKTIEQLYKDGQLVSEKVIEENVEQESTDRIVAIGTRAPVQILSSASPSVTHITRDGMTFGVKQILDNVTLTAYDAGFNSTGKTKDHPNYGVTYTGSTVHEGRTAAVDPDVIPLGWWMYIDGIGLRKAEDTGSAIKGRKIDIYMESEQEANRFGRQHGYTVYVIGPEKPQ